MKRLPLFIVLGLLLCGGVWVVLQRTSRSDRLTKTWPQRPVHLIVPLGTGTGLDLTARLYAARLSERWGQPVVIDNRPGADGIIGVSAFLGSDPADTLLFSLSAPYVLNHLTHEKLPYEPKRDLIPLSEATEAASVIAVTSQLSAMSLKDLAALAKQRPRELFWTATPGLAELSFSAFLKSERLEMKYVAYKEVSTSLQDLGEGRLHVIGTGLATAQPQLQAGKARVLAVQNSRRTSALPDMQTAAEAGYPILTFDGFYGFYGRRELADPVRQKISGDVQSVAAEGGLISRLAGMGLTARASTPEQFAERLDEQRAAAEKIVAMVGVKLR